MCLEEQTAVPPSALPLGFQTAEEAGGRNKKDYQYALIQLKSELHNQEYFVLSRNFLSFFYL